MRWTRSILLEGSWFREVGGGDWESRYQALLARLSTLTQEVSIPTPYPTTSLIPQLSTINLTFYNIPDPSTLNHSSVSLQHSVS